MMKVKRHKRKRFCIMQNILSKLSDHLFWDYDRNALDPDVSKRLIIERVFSRGTERDERLAFDYYGEEVIKNTAVDINFLDKKTLNYLSVILHIPKEKFKCYEKTLSPLPF